MGTEEFAPPEAVSLGFVPVGGKIPLGMPLVPPTPLEGKTPFGTPVPLARPLPECLCAPLVPWYTMWLLEGRLPIDEGL